MRSPERRTQAGASMLLTVSFMLIVVMFLALVVDTGRLYMEKRRIQRIADLAALDTADRATLCGSTQSADLLALAQASATRNGFTGTLTASQVQPGYIATSGGVRSFVQNTINVEAVRVQATRTVPASLFAGGLFGQQVVIGATSVAQRPLTAGIMAGTNLLTVDTKSSVLLAPVVAGLFGKSNLNVNIDALTYQGMAQIGITLRDFLGPNGVNVLTTDLTVGGINSALQSSVTLYDVINQSVALLNAAPGGTLASSLNSLHSGIKSASLKLSDILVVNSSQALDAWVNVADIINAAAYAANMSNAVDVTPNISIPGLTNTTLTLKVIQPPQIAYGRPGTDASGNKFTVAKTAQLKLLVSSKVTLSPIANMAIGVGVMSGAGQLWFKSGTCQTLSNPYNIVLNGITSAAVFGVGDPTWMASNDNWGTNASLLAPPTPTGHPATVTTVPVVGISVTTQMGSGLPMASGAGTDATYLVSSKSTQLPMTQNISSGLSSLSNSIGGLTLTPTVSISPLVTCPSVLYALVCSTVTTLVGTAVSTLSPLVTSVVSQILDPLLTQLGININSMAATLERINDKGAVLTI